MRELKDRVAVVTGAASGIGRATALELARAGMHIVLADINPVTLAEAAAEVEGLGRRALPVQIDVRRLADLERLLRETLAAFGTCHVMVNNAGVFHSNSILGASAEQWQRVIDTNLWGVIHGSRVFGAHFAQQREGHIVNTASAAGLFPVVGMSSYSTSKFAVVGFTKQLRWELSIYGVGVTVLCPGVIKTNIGTAEGAGLSAEDSAKFTAHSPGPEALARKVRNAIEHNRGLVRYGADSRIVAFLGALPLWLVDPLGRFIARRADLWLRGELKLP